MHQRGWVAIRRGGYAHVAGGGFVDFLVGLFDGHHQAVLRVRQSPVHLVRPGGVVVLRTGEELADHVVGHLRGHLATGMGTHSVGDQEELFVLDDAEGVFVVVVFQPRIRSGGVADVQVSPYSNPSSGATPSLDIFAVDSQDPK